MRVVTIVGTRPEIIKLSRVMAELDRFTDHIVVHSGQNYDYELNGIFFDELGIRKPDHFLEAAAPSACQTIGNVIAKADELLEQLKPDAVLILGDTNSCLAVIPAKRRKIPIFHMEAGNRCFDLRVPEEINRKIVDHLSDINMTFTEHARRYLLDEGLAPDRVIKTGSPMKEILNYHRPAIGASEVLDSLQLTSGQYFLVSAHREENIDSEQNFSDFLDTLNGIASRYQLPIIVSTHPRTRKRMETLNESELEFDEKIHFLKPLGFLDYVHLQMNAKCVVSDSGTITEEASILSFPAVTIRQAHERPEGMDEGTLIMCGLKANKVIESIEVVTQQHNSSQRNFKLISDYDVDNVSQKVVRIILSYTDFVNRTVWTKIGN